jgi:hypothetical protein
MRTRRGEQEQTSKQAMRDRARENNEEEEKERADEQTHQHSSKESGTARETLWKQPRRE